MTSAEWKQLNFYSGEATFGGIYSKKRVALCRPSYFSSLAPSFLKTAMANFRPTFYQKNPLSCINRLELITLWHLCDTVIALWFWATGIVTQPWLTYICYSATYREPVARSVLVTLKAPIVWILGALRPNWGCEGPKHDRGAAGVLIFSPKKQHMLLSGATWASPSDCWRDRYICYIILENSASFHVQMCHNVTQ